MMANSPSASVGERHRNIQGRQPCGHGAGPVQGRPATGWSVLPAGRYLGQCCVAGAAPLAALRAGRCRNGGRARLVARRATGCGSATASHSVFS